MLFGDADVEGPVGKGLAEYVEAGSARHGCGDRDYAFVLHRFLDEGLAEHFGVGRRRGLGLGLNPVAMSNLATLWPLSLDASAGP